ncbi:MAG: molybdopterin-dependent oxidoreductase [Ilumatobacteraceae bacterium]
MTVEIGAGGDRRIVDIDAAPGNPLTDGWICAKVKRHMRRVYAPERVTTPLIRVGAKGEGRFRIATWDEAIGTIADRMREAIGTAGSDSIVAFTYNSSAGAVERASTTEALFAALRRRARGAHDLRAHRRRAVGQRARRPAVGGPARRRPRLARGGVGCQPDRVEHPLPAARAAGGRTRRPSGGDRPEAHGDGRPCRPAPRRAPRRRHRARPCHREPLAAHRWDRPGVRRCPRRGRRRVPRRVGTLDARRGRRGDRPHRRRHRHAGRLVAHQPPGDAAHRVGSRAQRQRRRVVPSDPRVAGARRPRRCAGIRRDRQHRPRRRGPGDAGPRSTGRPDARCRCTRWVGGWRPAPTTRCACCSCKARTRW